LQYGSYLSAALTYLLLRQQDAVGLTLFDTEIRTHIRPSSRPSMLNNILSHLEHVTPGEETSILNSSVVGVGTLLPFSGSCSSSRVIRSRRIS